MALPILIISLLLTVVFSLATQLCIWREQSEHQKTEAGGALQVLMGDSRRLFANHFITKADVYLHRGVYPSIFDQARRERKVRLGKEQASSLEGNHEAHEEGDHDHDSHKHAEGEHEAQDAVTGLHGAPRDWIESFGRNFYPTKHAHLDSPADQKEVLPWLRMAAELNPNAIETYTVGAYWLWQRMGKLGEAEQFLREGLRANPGSFEVLFELGKLFEEGRKDYVRAGNLFRVALTKWQAVPSTGSAQSPTRANASMFLVCTGALACR